MTDVRKLTWTLETQDNASGNIDKVDGKLTGVAGKMEQIGGQMNNLGKGLSKKVTAPLVALGTASLHTVVGFDDGMSRVKGLTGATQKEFEQLRDKARELGATTAFSASDAAEGMQILAASGMEVNDILGTSKEMFDLMSAGAVGADTAASVLTNTMAQFNLNTEESGRIVDVFSQGAASAKLGVEDLEYIMGQAGGTMASMNMDMEQSVAMAGQLANAGTPIGTIGTTLNAMGREMKASAKEFQELGISVYDSSGEMRDMGAVLGDLETKLKGKTDAERDAMLATVFSGQAMKGAVDWLSKGSEGYSELTGEIYNSSGAAERFAAENEDNIGGAIRTMKSQIEDFAISIGDVIKEPIKEFAGFIGELTTKFTALSPEQQEFIVKIGAMATAIGPLLMIGGKLMSGIAGIPEKIENVKTGFSVLKGAMSPTTLIIAAIIGAGILLYKNWDKIKEKATEIGERISGAWSNLLEKVKGIWKGIQDRISGTLDNISEKWKAVTEFFSKPIQGVINIVSKGMDKVRGVFGKKNTKVDGRHRTGLSRVPRDGYVANLHKNEEVLRADDPRNINNRNSGYGSVSYETPINITIEGNTDNKTVHELERTMKRVIEQERNTFFKKLRVQGV